MPFNKLPIMGKNVEVTLKYGSDSGTFQAEPEKWNEKRENTRTSRKPLANGQKEIERTDLKLYELTFGGAKVCSDFQVIVAKMDLLSELGSSMSEDTISVEIVITNPNDATSAEKRVYTLCTLHDAGTAAEDLEGNLEETFTITAKKRTLSKGSGTSGAWVWTEVTLTT